MKIFAPRFCFRRVTDLTPAWLERQGLGALLLDVDNTLTTHNNPQVPPEVLAWLDRMKGAGVKLLLLSNNHPPRVAPFAQKLGLDFIADAAKPLGGGVARARQKLGAFSGGIALVGDQIFTDVLCANLAGIPSILVEPMQLEDSWPFKLKRWAERLVAGKFLGQRGVDGDG